MSEEKIELWRAGGHGRRHDARLQDHGRGRAPARWRDRHPHRTAELRASIPGTMSKIPFLRALTSLWDVLVLGIRTLMYSADVALGAGRGCRVQRPHRLGDGGRLLCYRHRPVFCRSAAAGGPDRPLHRVLLSEQRHRGRDPDDRLCGLHLAHRPGARHPAGVCLPWRRAQDDQRLRSRRRADARGGRQALDGPLSLRHGLSCCR